MISIIRYLLKQILNIAPQKMGPILFTLIDNKKNQIKIYIYFYKMKIQLKYNIRKLFILDISNIWMYNANVKL